MNSRVIPLDEAAYYGLPEATVEQPFTQVTWIFEQRLSRVPSKEGKTNYRYALSFYLRFLHETEGLAPFAIKERWDSLALVRFRTWLLTQEKDDSTQFGSHTLNGIVSAVRQVMTEAVVLEVAATHDIIPVARPIGPEARDYADDRREAAR